MIDQGRRKDTMKGQQHCVSPEGYHHFWWVTVCLSSHASSSQHEVQAGEKPSAHAATWLKRQGEVLSWRFHADMKYAFVWSDHFGIKQNHEVTAPKFNMFPLVGRRSGFLLGEGHFSGVSSLLNFGRVDLLGIKNPMNSFRFTSVRSVHFGHQFLAVNRGTCECDRIEKCDGWGDPRRRPNRRLVTPNGSQGIPSKMPLIQV